jgi:hypothetical protein
MVAVYASNKWHVIIGHIGGMLGIHYAASGRRGGSGRCGVGRLVIAVAKRDNIMQGGKHEPLLD